MEDTRQLDYLDPAVQNVLSTAAAVGPNIEPVELAIILDQPLLTIWAMLDNAVDCGVLQHMGDELTFRDNALRTTFANRLPAPDRAQMPLHAARRLIPAGVSDQRIARYLLAASASFDQDLLEWIAAVAAVLTLQDSRLVVRLLTRACAVGLPDDDIVEVLSVWRVRALLRCGRAAAAVPVVRSALEHARQSDRHPRELADMVWLCAHVEYTQGRFTDALETINAAIDRVDRHEAVRGRLSGLAALILLARQRTTDAEAAAAEAISVGESENDTTATGLGRHVLGMIRYHEGLLDEAAELGNEVADDHRHCGVLLQWRPLAFDLFAVRALCLIELGRTTEAEDTLNRSLELGRVEPGIDPTRSWRAHARLRFLTGNWDAVAEDQIESSSPVRADDPTTRSWSTLIEINRGIIGAEVLDPADFREASDTCEQQFVWSWARALADEANRQLADAIKRLVVLCDDTADGATMALRYYIYPDLARMALTAGDSKLSTQVALLAEQWESRYSTAARRGTALLCRGLADSKPTLVESAEVEFRAAGRPHYVGQACENLATLLGASGRRDDARAALYRAVDQYSALGAALGITRADARLRQFGIRRGRNRLSGHTNTGQPALTPAEKRVAELIALGHSNSEIAARTYLSQRTVESHVSAILAKRGAQSRVQLVANAEQGLRATRQQHSNGSSSN